MPASLALYLRCEADPFRLGQVFFNLFNNALEACPDPVQIQVSCQAADLGGRPGLRIVMRDNGPGFTPEQRQRAFEPFFTTKPKGEGSGLGLAIVKRLVEAHGGAMAVGDAAGGGASITFTLLRQPG